MEMMNIITEINRYTSISRERELTNTEKNERNTYRKLYLKKFRENFRNHLNNIKVVYVDENGNFGEAEKIEMLDDVSDWLSDKYEFCHDGFEIEEV